MCVCSGPVSLCSNRSGIGLGMAAWSLAHHTSQPQPLSADYKLQSRLQIMTKDVLGRLEDVQQKTQTHIMTCLHMNTHAHTLTQRSLGMHQFINIWSINNPKWDVKVVYKTWQANICIHVGLLDCNPPPNHVHHINVCTGKLDCSNVEFGFAVLLILRFQLLPSTVCVFLLLFQSSVWAMIMKWEQPRI